MKQQRDVGGGQLGVGINASTHVGDPGRQIPSLSALHCITHTNVMLFETHQPAPGRFTAASLPLMSQQGSKPITYFFLLFPSKALLIPELCEWAWQAPDINVPTLYWNDITQMGGLIGPLKGESRRRPQRGHHDSTMQIQETKFHRGIAISQPVLIKTTYLFLYGGSSKWNGLIKRRSV